MENPQSTISLFRVGRAPRLTRPGAQLMQKNRKRKREERQVGEVSVQRQDIRGRVEAKGTARAGRLLAPGFLQHDRGRRRLRGYHRSPTRPAMSRTRVQPTPLMLGQSDIPLLVPGRSSGHEGGSLASGETARARSSDCQPRDASLQVAGEFQVTDAAADKRRPLRTSGHQEVARAERDGATDVRKEGTRDRAVHGRNA